MMIMRRSPRDSEGAAGVEEADVDILTQEKKKGKKERKKKRKKERRKEGKKGLKRRR